MPRHDPILDWMSIAEVITRVWRRPDPFLGVLPIQLQRGDRFTGLKLERSTSGLSHIGRSKTWKRYIINLKTAKALGLTIPQSLLIRADEIIQ